MIRVCYPEPQFRIKQEAEQKLIFCSIRKKWLVLTDEEWVRQNFVNYLSTALHYPSTLIALEKELEINGLRKRFDILVYNKDHRPWMLVECKEPGTALSEQVLKQVLGYNVKVPSMYLVLTNGSSTLAWQNNNGLLILLTQLPAWPKI